MLQFWKKSGHSNKNFCPTTTNNANSSKTAIVSPKTCPLSSLEDEGLHDLDQFESTKERSKIARTLQEVLSDKSALNYFMQFLDSRSASRYILCWLDIDSFKSDLKEAKNCSPVPNSFKVDHDSLSVSTDCDSITADSNSLYDFSTATISHSSLELNSCDREPSDTSLKPQNFAVNSALMIFKKYIALEANYSIKCSEEVRKEIIESVCDNDQVLTGNCFDKIENYVVEIMEKDYFEAFLGSDYFCRYQIDILTSGNVALDDILYNETALFYFMEFLELENCRSLLEFWIAATNLQQQLHDQREFFDPIEAQNDAVVLYDKYFSLQAHCPLGFSDKVRFDVEQNICGENGLVLDCFQTPIKIVEHFLEKNFLKQFLASQLFYKYLSELINTVQSNGYAMNIENNKTSPSDCSSERSFSTNSTFLALELNNTSKKSRDKSADMTIDTRQLSDPDSLWKRKRNRTLSCGRINALGKFETDLEPEPDRNQFKLKNVVKKFVSLDEDKKKEEMAWQVAEMIVKDITSITLNQDKALNS